MQPVPGHCNIDQITVATKQTVSLCLHTCHCHIYRRDVPVGVPLDLITPTGMSCIGTYGENCKSDNVSKCRVLLVVFLILWHEKWKIQ